MMRRQARAIPWQENPGALGRVVPWWAWAMVAAGVVAAMPGIAQTSTTGSPIPTVEGPGHGAAPLVQVPEVVRPPSPSATLPSGNDGAVVTAPRSENPQVGGAGARPVPDHGVIVPPPSAGATTPVIKPPAMGTMPVIRPPGAGAGVVPK